LQNNKKLPECIDAYKNALKLNPQDEDARQNLQKALLQQKQEQQKENKEQNKPKQRKKKKKSNPNHSHPN
jgi:phosphoenolpyruvate-protein kinase (PTS system EI component)